MIPMVARRAQLLMAVSESARQDILHYLKVPPDRVRVVYEGIGAQFRRAEAVPLVMANGDCNGAVSLPDVAEVRARHALTFPYILTVGTLEPRKNHRRLIQAFTHLVQQERLPHHLVIAGTRGWKDRPLWIEARQSAMGDRIHFLGYVPAANLPGLYQGASAFAFPSLYEGFGLPVLEALACGVPTLISTDAALTEVAGHGTTVAAEAMSVEDIAAGLYRLLTDAALTVRLRERGFARARDFSWDRCAAETYRLYQEVYDESGPYTYWMDMVGTRAAR
jgi:alpha-1,3-rhamnosyl/mannosyltransferase